VQSTQFPDSHRSWSVAAIAAATKEPSQVEGLEEPAQDSRLAVMQYYASKLSEHKTQIKHPLAQPIEADASVESFVKLASYRKKKATKCHKDWAACQPGYGSFSQTASCQP